MTAEKKQNEGTREQKKTINSSYFFQKHVIWVLLSFLILGIWFQFFPLVLITTFLIFLTYFITAWKNQSLKKVQPAFELSKTRLFAGEDFQIKASIFNDKWLPLIWLEWELPRSKGVMIGDEHQNNYLIRFLWLQWFQKVNWEIEGKALKRGVYQLGQVILRSGDGFRFSEIEKMHDLKTPIYVYPKLVAVHVPAFRPSMQWEMKGKNGGFLEDPLKVSGIRDYQPGDEMKRFNGRASARTGKLQTNVYQPVVTEQLMIYGDVAGFVIDRVYEDQNEQTKYRLKQEELFESFLSVIASIAVEYHEQGIRLGYASNALSYKGKKINPIPPKQELLPMLDILAKSSQRVPQQKDHLLNELLHKGMLSGPLFIFCETVSKKHVLWYEQHKQKLTDVHFFYQSKSKYGEKLRATPINSFFSAADTAAKGS